MANYLRQVKSEQKDSTESKLQKRSVFTIQKDSTESKLQKRSVFITQKYSTESKEQKWSVLAIRWTQPSLNYRNGQYLLYRQI